MNDNFGYDRGEIVNLMAYGAAGEVANSVWIDGVNISNPKAGDLTMGYSQNWIDEVHVTGIGAPAEYGGFTGVVANYTTRPGGNQFHGLFDTFFQNQNLTWSNVPNPRPEKPFTTYDVSAQLGGPILKDKLWFFSGIQFPHTETPTPGTKEDPKGNFLFAPRDSALAQWDLTVDGAEPLLFRSQDASVSGIADPHHRWLVSQAGSTLAFYPLARSHPYVFRDRAKNVRFLPDGKSLIGNIDDVYIWSIPGENETRPRTLWTMKGGWGAGAIDVDPLGKHVLAATGDGVHLISIPDGKDLPLKGISLSQSYINVDHNNVAFSPDGKSAAAIGDGIEIWDLQYGRSRVLKQSKGKFCASLKYSPDGTLFSGCDGAVYRWNLKDDSAEILIRGKRWVSSIATSNNGRYLAAAFSSAKNIYEMRDATSDLVLYDLKEGKNTAISSHGNRVFCVAFDPSNTRLITGDLDGIVRVGQITGGTPHLLLGHEGGIGDIAVHPGGMWIASASGTTVRLWPMPQGKPLDSLPYNELLDRLRALTNVRAVADNSSPTGYRAKYAPFPG